MGTRFTDNLPFFVVCSPRSGFHFLGSLLESTQQFPAPIELSKRIEEQKYDEATDEQVLSFFDSVQQKTEKCGVWGTKVDHGRMSLIHRYLRLRGVRVNEVRWIWLQRESLLKLSISEAIALKKGLFFLRVDKFEKLKGRNDERVKLSTKPLKDKVCRRLIVHEGFRFFFEKNGIEPLIIRYEDFVEPHQWKATVIRVMDYIGVRYVENGLPIKSRFLKQSNDDETNRVIEEFLKANDTYYFYGT